MSSSTVMHKRWAPISEKVVSLRPVAHVMHPDDLRTALCGAVILGLPTFEPFETCAECKRLAASGDWLPLPAAALDPSP